MNREHLLFHLREALEELSRTIEECAKDPEYSEGELCVGMQHLYHHLNTAWNARAVAPQRIEQATDQDFNAWGLFPNDIEQLSV